jgi:hypothetical protein
MSDNTELNLLVATQGKKRLDGIYKYLLTELSEPCSDPYGVLLGYPYIDKLAG